MQFQYSLYPAQPPTQFQTYSIIDDYYGFHRCKERMNIARQVKNINENVDILKENVH